MQERRPENKMGVMPVKRLILTMSLPMIASMLVQALYNVVDSIFVARVAEDALTAVTLCFPMQNMMIAIASGTGVGVNALLSRSLGEKKYDRANAAANAAILLTVLSSLIFVVVGLFFARAFISSQSSDPQIVDYGYQYLFVICVCSLALYMQVMNERLLQSTGRTLLSMISQMSGAIINLILDPIMIFGLLGVPRMGVTGAALATVIGQSIAAVLGVYMNIRYNPDISISMKGILRPDGGVIRQIYAVGVPSILMMSIGSVMTYCMNRILIVFSSTATAVFGVYFRLQSFFFMPLIGLNNGVVPILAYNYGAKNRKRITESLRFSVVLAVSIMTVGMLIFLLIPDKLLRLFDASDEMVAIGVTALRIISIHFPIAGICIPLGSVFQAFSRGMYSLVISAGRQLVILIPVAWLLAQTGVLANVWWTFPISEVMSLVLTLSFFRKLYRETIVKL